MSFANMFRELASQMEEAEQAFSQIFSQSNGSTSGRPDPRSLPPSNSSRSGPGSEQPMAPQGHGGAMGCPGRRQQRYQSTRCPPACRPSRSLEPTAFSPSQASRRQMMSSSGWPSLFGGGGANSLIPSREAWPDFPQIDVQEEDNYVVVKANVPGYRKRDLQLSVQNNSLTLSGDTQNETTEGDPNSDSYFRRERNYGYFSRTVTLPCEVNPDGVVASCQNGVIRVSLPKTPEAVGHEIRIGDDDEASEENRQQNRPGRSGGYGAPITSNPNSSAQPEN